MLNNYLNRKSVIKSVVLLLSVIYLGTGCTNTKQNEVAIAEATAEEMTVTATEAVTETPKGLSTDEIAALEAEIDVLSELILSKAEEADIQSVLDQYIEESQRDIILIYYGEADNDFWIAPETVLPEDYEFSQRPVYLNAVQQGVYVPEAYSDFLTERIVHTIAKAVLVDGEVVGVIGIDIYGNSN